MIRQAFVALFAVAALAAQAQTYPNRPIKLMVGFEPGGRNCRTTFS